MFQLFRRLAGEEHGGEIIEWALIAGLIIIAAMAAVMTFGNSVLARWTTVTNSL